MNVLMITGDKNFVASERYASQAAQVEKLDVVYLGRENFWPSTPGESYEVVTAQDPFWRGLFAWKIARRCGARLNVQVHADLSAQSFVKRQLARFVLRRADAVRAVSEKIKKQVEALRVKAPVRVLPVFVDTEKFKQLERVPHEGKRILWLGRFEPEKDPGAALEVLKRVRAEVPSARLIMLGRGSLETTLKGRAAGLPAMPDGRPRVEFPGWQDPLPYLAKADVVLSTSRHESYGASMVEALAASVPVVAPDVGIAKEAGAIVVPRSELASAVVRVLQSKTRAELQVPVLGRDEWAQRWRNTLV